MPLSRNSVALRGGECVHSFLRICPLVLKAVPGQGIELIRVVTWVPGMLAEVRSQAVAGITDGDVNDLIDLIDSAGADKMFH